MEQSSVGEMGENIPGLDIYRHIVDVPPIYQIPGPVTPIPGHHTEDEGAAVRTMQQQVGPVGFEPTLAGS